MLITVQPNPSWQLSLAQLSPSLLFNILINKLPELYDQSCDPVTLGSLALLWANDLVILSTSGRAK